MEHLTIDREFWLTGTAMRRYDEQSSTLRWAATGQMCCLGFYGKKIGLTTTCLNGGGALTTTMREAGVLGVPGWLTRSLSVRDQMRFERIGGRSTAQMTVEDALVRVNDSTMHQIRKEAAVKYLFSKYGAVEVTFTGSYAAGTRRSRSAAQ